MIEKVNESYNRKLNQNQGQSIILDTLVKKSYSRQNYMKFRSAGRPVRQLFVAKRPTQCVVPAIGH